MSLTPAVIAAANVARESYAQLVSYLAVRTNGDIAGAEDALSDAFLAALKQWPQEGIPRNPNAWLLQIARRKWIDSQRRSQTRRSSEKSLIHAIETGVLEAEIAYDFPDDRLKLLFVCAHPAIDVAARAPLMLQIVLGMDAEKISSIFLTSPAAMSQRLVRVKSKIRDAGIPFRIPERGEWNERVAFVLDAIYAAYTAGRNECDGSGVAFTEDALWLARAAVELLPHESEALGLLALILHDHARRRARIVAGKYVPLHLQDTQLWDSRMQQQAESMLQQAATCKRVGRFQLEAAIQSVHASRAICGTIHWHAIAGFYDLLTTHTPAIGAAIGRAIAHARVSGALVGLKLLDELPATSTQDHLPYWAARAHLLADAQLRAEAAHAYHQAISLCTDVAMRAYLEEAFVSCTNCAV